MVIHTVQCAVGLALLDMQALGADTALKKTNYEKKRTFSSSKTLVDRSIIFSIYMVFLPSLYVRSSKYN